MFSEGNYCGNKNHQKNRDKYFFGLEKAITGNGTCKLLLFIHALKDNLPSSSLNYIWYPPDCRPILIVFFHLVYKDNHPERLLASEIVQTSLLYTELNWLGPQFQKTNQYAIQWELSYIVRNHVHQFTYYSLFDWPSVGTTDKGVFVWLSIILYKDAEWKGYL